MQTEKRFYANAYEAFMAGDWEAFERLGGYEHGLFETAMDTYYRYDTYYKYTGMNPPGPPENFIYLTSVEYKIE